MKRTQNLFGVIVAVAMMTACDSSSEIAGPAPEASRRAEAASAPGVSQALSVSATAASWTSVKLSSGRNYPGYEPVRYLKEGATVRLQGMLQGGQGRVFTLPSGYRPDGRLILSAPCSNSTKTCRVDVLTNGDVTLIDNANWISLSGLAFGAI